MMQTALQAHWKARCLVLMLSKDGESQTCLPLRIRLRLCLRRERRQELRHLRFQGVVSCARLVDRRACSLRSIPTLTWLPS
mmetsp:Transcript_4642/g.14052  ORF Transcript_4642/g.14052 Transcript_4642/m.14052 type:complete len:81 (-) Transcript_4642:9-251(-)